ncbi:MAG TPA: hypothetical protein PK006_11395 [Saprospiraceae bacterium]|nr:hypothetical protein [Saprospiraceae bacterium]
MADRSNQNLKAAAIIAVLALLGLNVYQFVNNRQLKTDNLVKENELEQLDKAKAELEKQYQDALTDLNDMKTNNAELNAMIDSQKEELRIQKDKIGTLLKDSKNLSAARKEMDGMKSKIQDYLNEIATLKSKNEQLTAENTGLTQDKENLTQEVKKKSEENANLSQEKTSLMSEKENLSAEKQALNKRVVRASVIQVDKIESEGFEMRDGKKPNDVSRAKNTDMIRVCFNTTRNTNADSGRERFYVRIIDPLGETQAIESQGSGILNSESSGDKIRYSFVVEDEYSNEIKTICGDWKNPGHFQKGVYQIEVYNKGYLVGTSSLKLK